LGAKPRLALLFYFWIIPVSLNVLYLHAFNKQDVFVELGQLGMLESKDIVAQSHCSP